jgi:hypothetical protein
LYAKAGNYEGNGCYIQVDWTEAGQVLDLIKAAPQAAPQKLRRCRYFRLAAYNVQFFTNGGVTPLTPARRPQNEAAQKPPDSYQLIRSAFPFMLKRKLSFLQ